uniref:(northern house mosquito) hypothetical protein n=1 Tax=Culex pipiens TaxID=7175 RepID=A0A8D8ADD8_CULPI
MNPSTNTQVSCNGPCRKRFPPAAVNMDQATANVLLSTCRTPGLQWLCPKCHHSVNLQLSTANRDGTELPPKLWIEIFRNLDKRSMLRVRSTCRRWRDIVDQNQSLRKEFGIRFLFKTTFDEQFSPENLFPASCATLFRATIVTVDAWWPPFGAGLTELFLGNCEVALPVLLGMLKETPNLTKLTLGGINYTTAEEVEVDFRLDKLDYLASDWVFEVFRNMAPRLRRLKLSSELDEEQEAKACRLLEAVQGTLRELEGNLTPFMLKKIAGMDRLELKSLVHRGEADLAVQLSRMKLSIEELDVIADNEDLCKIGRNLAKLRKARFALKDSEPVVPSFLDEMPLLKVLHLEGIGAFLNLNLLKSAHLISLHLDQFNFTVDCLQRYLTNCPNLQVLAISNCALDSWSDIFTARFNSLRCLRLWSNWVDKDIMSVPEKLIHLTELFISDHKMTTELLVKLLLQCPRLAKLTIGLMETINDEFVGMLSRFPHLRELHIYGCPLTDKAVKLVVDSGTHLRVQLDCNNISDAAIDLLSYVMRSRE